MAAMDIPSLKRDSATGILHLESSTYVHIDGLVESLQRALHVLSKLLRSWLTICSCRVSECIVQLAPLSLISCPRIASTLELLPMVILAPLPSTAKDGPTGLAVNIQKRKS